MKNGDIYISYRSGMGWKKSDVFNSVDAAMKFAKANHSKTSYEIMEVANFNDIVHYETPEKVPENISEKTSNKKVTSSKATTEGKKSSSSNREISSQRGSSSSNRETSSSRGYSSSTSTGVGSSLLGFGVIAALGLAIFAIWWLYSFISENIWVIMLLITLLGLLFINFKALQSKKRINLISVVILDILSPILLINISYSEPYQDPVSDFLCHHAPLALLFTDENKNIYITNKLQKLNISLLNTDKLAKNLSSFEIKQIPAVIRYQGIEYLEHSTKLSRNTEAFLKWMKEDVAYAKANPLNYVFSSEGPPSVKGMLSKITKYGYFNGYTEAEIQVAILRHSPTLIKDIKNPLNIMKEIVNHKFISSEDTNNMRHEQLIIVKKDWKNIYNIQYPYDEVVLEAEKKFNLKANEDLVNFVSGVKEKRKASKDPIDIRNIKNPSEELQLAAVKEFGDSIRHIKEPNEKVKLAAVKQSGTAIQYIKNPSKKVKKIATLALKNVKESQIQSFASGYGMIQYVTNPSEKLQLKAVKRYPHNLEFIKKPSEKVKLAAVQKNGYTLQYIKNPTKEIIVAAISRNGEAISYVKNPSESLKLKAVSRASVAILYIKSPSELVQLKAVETDGKAIKHIKNPSEEVKLAAVKEDGEAIKYIKDPSEAMKLEAATWYYNLEYIKNPTKKMILKAYRKNTDVLNAIKNPSDELVRKALQQSLKPIKYMKVSENIQLEMVGNSFLHLPWISNPSEKVLLAAVKLNGLRLGDIENQSKEVKQAAVRQNKCAALLIKNPSEVEVSLIKNGYSSCSKDDKAYMAGAFPYSIDNMHEDDKIMSVIGFQNIKSPSEKLQLEAVKSYPNLIEYIKNPSKEVKEAAKNKREKKYGR